MTINKDLSLISEMLSYRRPYGSASEQEFIDRFIIPLGVERDQHGNYFKLIGNLQPTVLWSCHTDSVHTAVGRQKTTFDGKYIRLDKKSKSSCLGADDAAGIFIMMHMIWAAVPGLYVFHYGEEVGCLGSTAIKDLSPEFLSGIQCAIAFDRRGTTDIITHQGGRCCSDEFALSLGKQLTGFKPSDQGILTDTKHYRKLVPECTNLSVGYYDEHRSTERLDFGHLVALRDMMVCIEPDRFVVARDPAAAPTGDDYDWMDEGFYGSSYGSGFGSGYLPKTPARTETLETLCWDYPKQVAQVLKACGIDHPTLKGAIQSLRDAERKSYASTFKGAAPVTTKTSPKSPKTPKAKHGVPPPTVPIVPTVPKVPSASPPSASDTPPTTTPEPMKDAA